MKKNLPVIVIHAGAGRFLGSKAKEERARESLLRIVSDAFSLLKTKSALEVVTFAVTELENDPQFNAGTGGKLQSDGVARLSASVMDGDKKRFAGVMNIEQVKNPILISRKLLPEKDRVLAAEGAKGFARGLGFASYNPITEEMWAEWKMKKERGIPAQKDAHGTVGAVAVDIKGRLAAATSTGGKGMEKAGRVSDSATVAGNYASKTAAISATGVGEEIVDLALAARIVTRVDDGSSLDLAFSKTFKELRASHGRAGAIGVDLKGNVSVMTTTECILHAICTPKYTKGYP